MEHFSELLTIETQIKDKLNAEIDPTIGTAQWRDSVIQLIREYLTRYRDADLGFDAEKYLFLLEASTNIQINDSEQTENILETFFRSEYESYNVFSHLTDRKVLNEMLRHAYERRFDFWGLRRDTGIRSWKYNPVVLSLVSMHLKDGKFRDVWDLLIYGFRYSFQQLVYESRCIDFLFHRFTSYIIYSPRGALRMMNKDNPFRMLLITDTFSLFATKRPLHSRLLCLSFIYRSIPQPYVTPREMFDEISSVVNEEFFARLTIVARQYTMFRNSRNRYFDQDDCTLQPRPVRHLCRCRIRAALAANLALPYGVWSLGVAPTIAGYLQLMSV